MVRIAIAANPRKTFVSTIQRLQDLEACGRPFLGRERTVKVVVGVDAWAIVTAIGEYGSNSKHPSVVPTCAISWMARQ